MPVSKQPAAFGLNTGRPLKSARCRRAALFLSAGLLLGTPILASAQNWDGGGADNNWGTSLNWAFNIVPAAVNADVIFGASARLLPNIDANRQVRSITFNSASNYTFSATGSFTLGVAASTPVTNSIVVSGSGNAIFDAGIQLSNSSTFSVTGANLAFRNGFTSVGVLPIALNLNVSPGRTFSVAGFHVYDVTDINITGGGTVNYTGVSGSGVSSLSSITVTSGELFNSTPGVPTSGSLLRDLALLSGVVRTAGSRLSNVYSIEPGTTLDLNATSTASASGSISGGLITGTGTTTFNGSLSILGDTTETTRLAAPFAMGLGSLNVARNVLRSADLILDSRYIGASLQINGDGVTRFGTNFASSSLTSVLINGGRLQLTPNLNVASFPIFDLIGTGSTLESAPGPTGSFNGRVYVSAGGTTLQNFSVTTSIDVFPYIDPTTAVIIRNVTAGTVQVFSGNVVTIASSSALNTGALTVDGTLNMPLIGSVVSTGSTVISQSGQLVVNSGPLIANLTSSGEVRVPSTDGRLQGTVTFTPTATLTFAQPLFNPRLTLNPGSTLTTAATLTLPAFTSIVATGSTVTNSGTINLAGGNIEAAQLLNSGLITGNGAFGGTTSRFTNNATGNWVITGPMAVLPVGVRNLGTIEVQSPATLTAPSGGTTTLLNGGQITLQGGDLVNFRLTNTNTGVIAGFGVLSGLAQFDNQGLLRVENGLLNLAYTGTFTNSGALRIASSGSLTGTAALSNTGRISGDGLLSLPVQNRSPGRIETSAGELTLALPLSTFTGSQISVGSGSALLLLGGFTADTQSALLALSGGTLDTFARPLTNAATGNISGFGSINASTLRNSGSITLAGGTSLINAAVVNDLARTLRVQSGVAIFNGPVTNNGTLTVTSGDAIFTAGFSGGPVSSPTPTGFVGGGALTLSPGAYFSADGLLQTSLSLQGSDVSPATLRITSREVGDVIPPTGRTSAPSLSVLSSISITSAAGNFLDLTTNDLLLRSTGASFATDLATLTLMARKFVTSGSAGLGSTSPTPFTAIAIFPNEARPGVPYFDSYGGPTGLPLTSTDILARFTYIGDTDLSGTVDGTDLANLLEGLSLGLTGWRNGDLDYDGSVTPADLSLLLTTLGASGLTPLGSPAEASVLSGGGAAIPEPVALGIAPIALLPLARRRNR